MNNLEILFKELSEATGAIDLKHQRIATDFYKKLRKWLGNSDNLEYMGESKRFNGYALPAEWIDPKYKDLVIFLGYSVPGVDSSGARYSIKGAYGKIYSGKHAIIINSLIGPYDLQYIDTRLNRQTFVHEFIHYLDAKRYKRSTRGGKAEKASHGANAYFNTPYEFNAFFQDGAAEIAYSVRALETYTSSKIKQIMTQRIFGAGFHDFYKFALTQMDKTFVENLKGKYERKFKSRLYQLWRELSKGRKK